MHMVCLCSRCSQTVLRLETSTDGAPRSRRPTVPDVDPNNLLGGRGGRRRFATSTTGEFHNKSAYVRLVKIIYFLCIEFLMDVELHAGAPEEDMDQELLPRPVPGPTATGRFISNCSSLSCVTQNSVSSLVQA